MSLYNDDGPSHNKWAGMHDATPAAHDVRAEHGAQLQWAAAVMAREIELHAEIVGNLDPRTLEVLTRHLREVGLGEKDPHGLMLRTRLQKQLDDADPKISQYLANKYGETTELPPSVKPYVERSDTDLPAHPDA